MLKGYVHIIESPAANDLLDGRSEGRMLSESLRLAGIPFFYSLAADKETLERSFRERLLEAMQKYQSHPIFHLSMHGNTDGIALTDRTFVDWACLRDLIAPVTNAATHGMLLCMSTCYGASARRIVVETSTEVRLWALVGNRNEASWADAAIGYSAFYHRLFKGAPIDEAVEAMKRASGNDDFELMHGHELKASWKESSALDVADLLAALQSGGT